MSRFKLGVVPTTEDIVHPKPSKRHLHMARIGHQTNEKSNPVIFLSPNFASLSKPTFRKQPI